MASLAIPFNDLHHRFAANADDYRAAIERVLTGGRFILGPEVEAFESEFADSLGGGHAIGVANGTDAIELSLRAAGIGPDDEVITVAHTAAATACAIERAGARPVFADILPLEYTIDPRAVNGALTRRTRAIVAVHLYGQPARLRELRAIADREKILLIEDCAQAHAAKYAGRPVGTIGHLAAFSFYPTKNLGTFGDAGAVFTTDAQFANRVRRLRNYGQRDRYVHELPGGFNSRLDEMQAAILRVGLPRLQEHNAERRHLADRYLSRLRLPSLPCPAADTEHVYHLFVVTHPARDHFRAHLSQRGVETLIHYPIPIHLQPAFAQWGGKPGQLPHTERVAEEVVSLPLYPGLSDQSQDLVIKAVNAAAVAERGLSITARPEMEPSRGHKVAA